MLNGAARLPLQSLELETRIGIFVIQNCVKPIWIIYVPFPPPLPLLPTKSPALPHSLTYSHLFLAPSLTPSLAPFVTYLASSLPSSSPLLHLHARFRIGVCIASCAACVGALVSPEQQALQRGQPQDAIGYVRPSHRTKAVVPASRASQLVNI